MTDDVKVVIEQLAKARRRIWPLKKYGEDNVWRPATTAYDAMGTAIEALASQRQWCADMEAAKAEDEVDLWTTDHERLAYARWNRFRNFWERAVLTADGEWVWLEIEVAPTHWMPIPAAPAPPEAE